MSQTNTKKMQLKSLYLVVYFVSIVTAIAVFLYLTRFLGLSPENFMTVAKTTLFVGLVSAIVGIILVKIISKKNRY